eukprot:3950795-Lingulodinium_polyedra.AAC.1
MAPASRAAGCDTVAHGVGRGPAVDFRALEVRGSIRLWTFGPRKSAVVYGCGLPGPESPR